MGLGERSPEPCTGYIADDIIPERDLALPFSELQANISVQEQKWGCLESVNLWERLPVLGRGMEM